MFGWTAAIQSHSVVATLHTSRGTIDTTQSKRGETFARVGPPYRIVLDTDENLHSYSPWSVLRQGNPDDAVFTLVCRIVCQVKRFMSSHVMNRERTLDLLPGVVNFHQLNRNMDPFV